MSKLTVDLTPLRISREFRLLFLGQTVSQFGSMITFVVLPWQMYQITKSTFAVGMMGVVEFFPTIIMAFIGGALADYVDRRRWIWMMEAGMIGCDIVLMVNSLLPQPRAYILFIVAGIFAGLNGLQRPSREALTPKIVPLEYMPAVGALNSLRWSTASIIGPALGGVLAASFGAFSAYVIDTATFVFSLITLTMMRTSPPPPSADRPSFKSLATGLRYAWSRQELIGTYLIDINAMFFGMPMALFPALAENYGASSLGLLYAAPAAGIAVASFTSGWTSRVHKHGLAVTIAAALWGVAIIFFGLVNSLWLALLFLALAGAADGISGIFRMTIWNQTIPDHLRGRLAGIEMISYTTGPLLGNAEAGIVASMFSLRTSIVSGGVLCVAGSVLLACFLPAFVKYDGRKGLARKLAEEVERSNNLPIT